MKVGRRLAIKLLNAARFALLQAEPRGPITEPLDRGMLTALSRARGRVDRAARGLRLRPRARADRERSSGRFCDDYLELVKSRRYGDFGPEAAASANSAMLVALSTLLRLFAPYLPFVTEEVWSWWQSGLGASRALADGGGSAWQPIGGADDVQRCRVREATQGALAEVRRIKSLLKKPAKAVIARARAAGGISRACGRRRATSRRPRTSAS